MKKRIKPCILVSPHSHAAKVYPYWQDLIELLTNRYEVLQTGVAEEPKYKQVTEYVWDKKLSELEKTLLDVGRFVSVDNFFHHMAYYLGISGVVLFGPSNPQIFGHGCHINLWKGYARKDQFQYYKDYVWDRKHDGWFNPEQVYREVVNGDLTRAK